MSTEAQPPFAALSDEAIGVLDDMFDEWMNKDRHGELRSEYSYSDERASAYYAMCTVFYAERRRRFGF